jgi:hypothetical protein
MNINPYNLNYQDGLNTYPIIDYINDQIGLGGGGTGGGINSYVYLYQNSNLMIANNTSNASIYFRVYNSPNATNGNYPYSVKIDKDGKLYVYHIYDVFNPTMGAGWYDLEKEMANAIFNTIQTNIQFLAIEGELVILAGNIATNQTNFNNFKNLTNASLLKISDSLETIGNSFQALTTEETTDAIFRASGSISAYVNNSRALFSVQRSFYNQLRVGLGNVANVVTNPFLVAGVGLTAGLIGMILGTNSYNYNDRFDTNSNGDFTLDATTRAEVRTSNYSNILQFTSNFITDMSNINVTFGFINSNVTSTQFIPTLKSNKVLLGNITTPNASYQMEMTGDLNTNMLWINSTSLTTLLNQKQNNMSATQPIYITTSTIGLNYDSTLTKIGNNLSVASATASKWTTSGNNIYNNNTANVGIGNNNPLYKLSVDGAGEFITPNGNKLIFSYIANAYKHRIYTNHNSGADSGNSIDFYTWRFGQGVNDEGDRHCLRLSATHTQFPSSTNKYFWINDKTIDSGNNDYTSTSLTIFNKTASSSTVLNDPQRVLALARQGTSAQTYGQTATFKLSRWENSSTNSRTRLDIDLSDNANDDVNVMVLRSDGRVGINTTIPTSRFTIKGDYSVVDNNFCLDASDGSGVNNKYNFKIYPYVIGAGQIGYKFRVVNNTSTTTDFLTIDHNGNVGIGNVTPSYKFQIEDGSCFLGDSAYSSSATGTPNGYRLILDNTYNGTAGSGTNCNKLLLHNTASFNGGFGIEQGAVTYQSGDSHSFYTGTTQSSYGTRRMLLSSAGNLNINANNNAYTRLNVTGVASINGGNVYGAYNNQLLAGALCIGDTTTNYGGAGGWSTNTAGLLMECLNNTEIVILDSAEYLISALYYVGGTSKYIEYGRAMGYGHPNAHYFRCNNVFECYFANGAGGWQYFKVEPTSLWGDGLSTASDQAGTKYLTIRNIMLQNPHIVPASVGATASIRLGRAGGVQSGTWYEIGTRSDGVFHIVKEADSKFGINLSSSGDVGIYNSAPVNFTYGPNLHLGRCGGGYICDAKVTIVKDTNTGSVRQNIIGWNSSFYYVFCGDGGGANNNSYWSQQCYVYYSAPASCLYINSGGYVTMAYSYGTSDQRIKSDIKTIDNALFKVLNLRGIEYTDIREGCRHIGLIAQEVEEVIPEIVNTNEETGLKSIAYANMAGLFVNAIKDLNDIILKQNAKINNLMERIERLENGLK